ncbi:hypothetical protein [Halocola ammonii]
MRNFILCFFAIVCSCLTGFGQQDTILTLEGNAIPCAVRDTTGFFVQYSIFKRNGKEKEREVHRSEIFSITKASGKEVVYYEPDLFLGEDLSPEEMRIYVTGARDARENYRPIWTFVGGVAFAGIVSYIGQGGFILTIAPPIAYMLVQFIPYIKIKEENMTNLSYQYNDLYAAGYESVARGRKVLSGLKGGTLGSILGFLTQLLIPLEN